jgi:hypothetical protein
MPQGQKIEQRRRDGKTGKADEDDGNDGVPHEGHVATQGRYYIFCVHHGLTLSGS